MAFDNSCILWDEHCGQQGSCRFYKPWDLSINMMILNIIVKFLSLTFVILAWRLYKPPPEGTMVVQEVNEKREKIGIRKKGYMIYASNIDSYANAEDHMSAM